MRYLYLFLLSLLIACAQAPQKETPLPPQLANPYLKQPSEKAVYTPVKKITLADGLSSNNIQKIFKDSKGFLWIGTSNGLNRYDGLTIKNYWHDNDDANSILHNNIIDIAEDSVGNILVLTQKGVNLIQPNQVIRTYVESNWLLFFYKHKTHAIFTVLQQDSIKNSPMFRFVKDSKNQFWQIDSNKISQIDANLLLKRMIPFFDGGSNLPLVWVNKNDSIGFQFQRGYSNIVVDSQDSSVLNSVKEALLHKEQLNLLSLGRENFQYLFAPKDLNITNILLEQNNIWIGTETGLFHYSKQIHLFDDFVQKKEHDLLPTRSVKYPNNGVVKSMICWYEGHGIHQVAIKNKNSMPIIQIFIDKNEKKWGISRNQLRSIKPTIPQDTNWMNEVFEIYKHKQEMTQFMIEFDGNIQRFFIDRRNRIWIGTESGLYQMMDTVKGTCIRYAQNAGFEHLQISEISEDSYGQLWISTNGGGIIVFSPELGQVVCTFTEEDGLMTNHFQYLLAVRLGEISSHFSFASERGDAVFHPDSLYRNTEPPNIVITSVKANEVEKYSADIKNYTFTLPYDSNSLIITPRVLNLTQPHRNKIRYKLEGVDADYCKPLAIKDLHYPHLAAGEYTLLIQGANNHGVWNPQPTRCYIKILPAWWQTWWFRLLVGGLMIVLSSRFFYMRQRHTNQKHQRETDALQARVLQAQLNPHFIFNVLTLVQSKIMNEVPQDASDLLVRLSKLLRNFLESSILSSHESGQFQEIELEKEIELLTEYIDFERLKNDCRFEYHLNIAPNIEPSNEKLPPFFIQPYVENAIKHGLLYRNDDQGILTITFDKKVEQGDSYLVCTVSDNGVGRSQAQVLQNKDKKLHKSRGTELIENRLKILNSYKYAIQIDTYDNEPSGTKVVIQFKYKS